MREIVLDTETTGLDPQAGHRIVEIGLVELLNHLPTGRTWQTYLNPERDMPDEAFRVHGLSRDFLAGHPLFAEQVADFLEFVGSDSRLVIHNAEFDMRFVNAELDRLGFPALPMSRVVDTMTLARKKFPGAPASLDALCKRFDVDLAQRDKHGALLDAQLLARVYFELMGGQQPDLALAGGPARALAQRQKAGGPAIRAARPHAPSAEEEAAHAAFLKKLTNPLWAN
ncbi:MAG: DNA polymerase III subunit epsilon [Rhodospirillales bacterium]|nr:DNA polymerase III subunit epsilon [Rhodospirillales bacterium]